MTASTATIALLSICSFLGNIGAAVTGFGQAIIYLFVWQIVELAGYDGDFKYAVFIQALSLFSMQPLLLHKAQVIKFAYRYILLLFVPITLVSTPLGQLVSDKIPTKIVQAVAGGLVTFVACWEIYSKRNWFKSFCKRKDDGGEKDEGKVVEEVAGNAEGDVEKGDDSVAGTKQIDKDTDPTKPKKADEDEFEENQLASNEPSDPASSKSTSNGSDVKKSQRDTESKSESNSAKEPSETLKIGANKATFWTLLAGGASGFLGGMVAIRGPPLIFYFLHPPHPVSFDKNTQRATGVVIMFCNVTMRQIFYLVNTWSGNGRIGYDKEDWRLYLSVIICSIAGGFVGSKLFQYVKDSKDTIRGILSVFLFLCGVSLLFSAFR